MIEGAFIEDDTSLSTFEQYEQRYANKVDVVDGGHGAGRGHADMTAWCEDACGGAWTSCATPGDDTAVDVVRWYFEYETDAEAFIATFGGVPR
jgi:hypothetical protein